MVSCSSVVSCRTSLTLMKDGMQRDCARVVSWKTRTGS